MDLPMRQKHILISLLRGVRSLQTILVQPEFTEVTERTLQRDLSELLDSEMVERRGEARAITYHITPKGSLHIALPDEELEKIFSNDARQNLTYDFTRLDVIEKNDLFSKPEQKMLSVYHAIFLEKLKVAPKDIIRRERERITIELSWKSSQIEGNTYSLLETETLLKEGIAAPGKSEEETKMVLNHKSALDFSEQQKKLFAGALTVQSVIELHRILAKDIMSDGLRERLVGITGSAYRPLDNKFQIEDELTRFCAVVNAKENIFEKALIAFTYICYLQPFNDGNKRTARILANAILYAHDSFPLSLRAVSVAEYKLAILAFYELGILGNCKKVFIGQAKFAAEQYAI